MAPDRGLAPMPGSYGPGVVVKHRSRRVVDWGVVSGAWMVMVRVVIGVLRVGRCGSALFQRDRGDLTLRTLMRGRRGGSSVARTAWPMRPGPVVSSVMTPSAAVRVSVAVCSAEMKLARSGSVSGTDSTAVTMALRRAW